MDPGAGFPHNFIPPQPFQFRAPAYPFAGPATAPIPALGAATSGFFNPWEQPPPPAPPPPNADLQRRIDKLVEYAAKNGPQFEALMKDKQKENPAYSFLFGAEGHDYYRYRLWLTINPRLGALNPAPTLAQANPNLPSLNPPLTAALNSNMNSALAAIGPPPQQPGAVFRPPAADFFLHQQQRQQQQQQQGLGQPFFEQYQHDNYGQYPAEQFIPPAQLPPEVRLEFQEVLDGLTGTKESIKGTKMWFMQRAAFGPALAEVMRDRALGLDGDVERQLHLIYLANDILFNSLQHRPNPSEIDDEALAFRSVLGPMLAAVYHNQQDPVVNQERLQKILQFWAAKEVFDNDTINNLEGEMLAGPPPPSESSLAMQASAVGISPVSTSLAGSATYQFPGQWQSDQSHTAQPSADQRQLQEPAQQSNVSISGVVPVPPSFFGAGLPFTAAGASQYVAGSAQSIYASLPVPPFLAPLPAPVTQSTTPVLAQLPNLRNADQPPYPLFPPGLIPGMVRKMQIGSGVPYSPVSPLDIPTVIPPATSTESYILERVAKYFKEIGEIDPLEGQFEAGGGVGARKDVDEGEGREGGTCIPPPSHMQSDPETGALPDGSIERRPGVGSTGRLGLGAAADPNIVTQYDDVYTSYRKQRSTNYHTSLSARAAAAR